MVCSGTGELSERERLRLGKQSDFGYESVYDLNFLVLTKSYEKIFSINETQ